MRDSLVLHKLLMEQSAAAVVEISADHVGGRYTLQDLPDGWKIEVSDIGPGVGQPGGGVQVRILSEDGQPVRVEDLLNMEF